MSKGINKWHGIGNCCADPETRYLPNGDAVTNLTIACNDSYKDKNSGEVVDKTEFVRIVFFRKLAEICGQYLKKGSKIYVEGKIQTRKWQDKEGQDRYTTEIVARDMQMLDSRPEGQPRPQQKPQQQGYSGPPGGQQPSTDYDDDVAF